MNQQPEAAAIAMHAYHVALTLVSRNKKTGPIPVSTSARETCPPSCAFYDKGCYAKGGPLGLFWRKVSEKKAGIAWQEFLQGVKRLPKGQLWRHNQAGDLPGIESEIDKAALKDLVQANKGKRGFTYTHKPMTPRNQELVRNANAMGFTINLSADSLEHADKLAALEVGPVAVVLPSDQTRATLTPSGRKVAICPAAISDRVTCATCGLCANAKRKSIIGFPAHGASKKHVSELVKGEES